jgi:hypothetical protein
VAFIDVATKPEGEGDDQIAMSHRRCARRHDETAIRLARECRDRSVFVWSLTLIVRTAFWIVRRQMI